MVTLSRQCCQVLFVLSVSVSLSLSLSISLSLSLSLCPCLPPLSSVLCSSQRKLVYITGISSRGQVIHSLPLHSQSPASLCPSIFFLLLSFPPSPLSLSPYPRYLSFSLTLYFPLSPHLNNDCLHFPLSFI